MTAAAHDEFVLVPGYFGQRVRGKLAGQRKSRDWSVSPTDDDRLIIQADGCIGAFDVKSGVGVLNTRGGYFPHLSAALGARAFKFPTEFVAACLRACPSLDGETTRGGVTLMHTVQVIR